MNVKKQITLYTRKIAKELFACVIMYKNTKYRIEGHRKALVSLYSKCAYFIIISEQVRLDVNIGTNLIFISGLLMISCITNLHCVYWSNTTIFIGRI